MLRSFHVVMMMISLLVIIKNFLGGVCAPPQTPLPAGTAELKISTSEYLTCASKCAISRLNHQKVSWEGRGTAHPWTPPPRGLRPLSFALYSYTYILLYCTCSRTLKSVGLYIRISEMCIKMRHFKIKYKKIKNFPRQTLSGQGQQNKISTSEYLRYA